jgi:4-amino-4-deoxy-L-arabinose transferase-like glycosyltransferase
MHKALKDRQTIFSLFAIPFSITMALIIGPILRGGMFMDGLLYTNLAKNMASGLGDFWHPTLDRGSIFYEHPPFLFWLESLFFRLFGDHIFVEDIYNTSVFLITVALMYGIWCEIVVKY